MSLIKIKCKDAIKKDSYLQYDNCTLYSALTRINISDYYSLRWTPRILLANHTLIETLMSNIEFCLYR